MVTELTLENLLRLCYILAEKTEGGIPVRRNHPFFRSVCALAIPVALQSMLQSSFSIVDQIMIGRLGDVSVAAVGFAGKFTGIYSVIVAAFGAVAGIMISQFLGQKNTAEVRRSFSVNLIFSVVFAAFFTVMCAFLPTQIMGLYTDQAETRDVAASYLFLLSGTFLPMAGATMLATVLRCVEKASYPLYAGIFAAVANTVLNYILIFGKLGFAKMGADGAAIATLASQWLNFLLMAVLYRHVRRTSDLPMERRTSWGGFRWKQFTVVLLPALICEVLWSLGENVYAIIYGHLGTQAGAAMTLTYPLQNLTIGALCGLSQAAAVIVGKRLGSDDRDGAYLAAKRLMLYGLVGALIFSGLIVLLRGLYVEIYAVKAETRRIATQILLAYAAVVPFKVLNMIAGGGVLRSGGRTAYAMAVDIVGTWGFGVPLGIIASSVLGLSIPWVYFILSLEECVRLGITLVLFRRKKWMNRLEA